MPPKQFNRQVELPVSAEEAFAWHERPGALDRLIPPWESVTVVDRGNGINNDSVVKIAAKLGPIKLPWHASHHDYDAGKQFCDTQIRGPFAVWEHEHKFVTDADGNGRLEDNVEYKVPGGAIGSLLGGAMIRSKLTRMFNYRHNTTVADLAAHSKFQDATRMKVALTGATGLVGSSLVPLLTTGGHSVVRLVRREAGEGEVTWDPQAEKFDASPLTGVDAVVHLAGENIAGARWNKKVKQRLRDSRIGATRALCDGLARMATPPKVLVCASAIGIYGDRGDEPLDEGSSAGTSFLAKLCEEWEAATQPVTEAGVRVVNLRFGVILSPRGGALAKMLLPFKMGVGGKLGSGRQFMSWLSIDDAADMIHHALMTDHLSGPVNAVAPNPVTNLEFTKTLGKVLRRPTVFPVPGFAARLAFGEMADELLLASTRVEPKQLEHSDYDFRHPTLEDALRHVLGRA